MECRVMSDLSNHEIHCDQLENKWVADRANKRIEVVEFAKRILNQDVDVYTFETAFATHFDFDDEKDFEVLMMVLAEIESGEYTNLKLVHHVATLALDAAAYCLYDIELNQLGADELYFINEVLDEIDY